MMKKLITTMMLIGLVAGANATLTIVVWDEASGGWYDYPDSTLVIIPSQIITIGLQDDALTPGGVYALGISDGPGELLGTVDILASGVSAVFENGGVMLTLDVSSDGILATTEFHCTGEGDVPLTIYDNDGNLEDELIIHQVPEPATLALLGLGGLLLRKRRSA